MAERVIVVGLVSGDAWPADIWNKMRDDDVAAIAREIDAAVAEALAARWVPVGERLPEAGVYVLASVSEPDSVTNMCITRILSGGWACERTGHTVLAWQPLPAAWVAR